MTLISFAIPFKDRIGRLKVVVKSIIDACYSGQIQDWEIVLSNNASSLQSLQELQYFINVDLSEYSHCIRLHSLERTISLPENWLYALSLCKGKILNIRRSCDRLIKLDRSILEILSSESLHDYVLTPVYIPSIQGEDTRVSYLRSVNKARSLIGLSMSSEVKFKLLFSGFNQLGDLGGLYFKSHCMQQLSLPIDMYNPSFISWPDHEIYIRLLLLYKGSYLNIQTSELTFSNVSSSARAAKDPIFDDYSYCFPRVLNTFLPFYPQYRFLFDEVSFPLKIAYLSRAIVLILGYAKNPLHLFFLPSVFLFSMLLIVKNAVLGMRSKIIALSTKVYGK